MLLLPYLLTLRIAIQGRYILDSGQQSSPVPFHRQILLPSPGARMFFGTPGRFKRFVGIHNVGGNGLLAEASRPDSTTLIAIIALLVPTQSLDFLTYAWSKSSCNRYESRKGLPSEHFDDRAINMMHVNGMFLVPDAARHLMVLPVLVEIS